MKKSFTASLLIFMFALAALVLSFHGVSHAAAKKIECGVISGKVMHMPAAGAEWAECSGTFEIKTGGKIKLDAAGEALVQYSDGTMVTLRPETELEIKADGIRLNEGGIWIKLIKTKSGFKVDTPSVTIGARGTIFSVLKKQEKTLVKLVEGLIDIVNRESGKKLAMKAGDTVIVKAKEIIEINKIDQAKINAILKENSFDPVDIDLTKVPVIFKFDVNSLKTIIKTGKPEKSEPADGSKEIELKKKKDAKTGGADIEKPQGAASDDTVETESGANDIKADDSETGSAGTGNEKTLNELIGR